MSEKGETAKAKPRRRWFQFSLGSMLLLMTVFGVWFGIRIDRARRQEAAVAALRERGDVFLRGAIPYVSGHKEAPLGAEMVASYSG